MQFGTRLGEREHGGKLGLDGSESLVVVCLLCREAGGRFRCVSVSGAVDLQGRRVLTADKLNKDEAEDSYIICYLSFCHIGVISNYQHRTCSQKLPSHYSRTQLFQIRRFCVGFD